MKKFSVRRVSVNDDQRTLEKHLANLKITIVRQFGGMKDNSGYFTIFIVYKQNEIWYV